MKFGYKINRPVLLLAPDAVLTINQNTAVSVTRDAKNYSHNLVDIVTRMTVNLNLEGGQGSASIDLAIPRHASSSLYGAGKINIDLMSEVHIYMKGRFLGNEEKPQYYRVFWGLVTNVEESYSDGFYSVHLSCQDMLKWWDLSRVITQDSVLNSVYTSSPYRALAQIYSYLTAPEIIYALSLAMFSDEALVVNPLLGTPVLTQETLSRQATVYESSLAYWRKRFSNLKVGLSIVGISGKDIEQADKIFNGKPETKPTPVQQRLAAIKAAITGKDNDKTTFETFFKPLKDIRMLTKPDGKFLDPTQIALPLFNEVSGQLDPFNLGVKSPLEVAQEVKSRINYEFFMAAGVVFTLKPPYYNLKSADFDNKNKLNNEESVYVINDMDLLSYTISHNLDQIYTRINLEGSFTADQGVSNRPSTFYIDPEKSRKYGIKDISKSFNFIRDTDTLNYFAVAELNHINKKEYTGSITIAGRPELKLGMPVYLQCEDIYAYIVSINHDFDFGQSFTTTLGVECIRRRVDTATKYLQLDVKPSNSIQDAETIKGAFLNNNEASSALSSLQEYFIKAKPNNTNIKNLKWEDKFRDNFTKFLTELQLNDTTSPIFIAVIQDWLKQSSSSAPAQEAQPDYTKAIKKVDSLISSFSSFNTKKVDSLEKEKPGFRYTDDKGFELILGFDYGLSIPVTGIQITPTEFNSP